MTRITALPKCFTDEILSEIWDEILPQGYDPAVRQAIMIELYPPRPNCCSISCRPAWNIHTLPQPRIWRRCWG